jgi:phosphoserine phosphatase
MLQAAGLGIAYHATPIVAAAARAQVRHADLRALLFAQGYRAAEFAVPG